MAGCKEAGGKELEARTKALYHVMQSIEVSAQRRQRPRHLKRSSDVGTCSSCSECRTWMDVKEIASARGAWAAARASWACTAR